METERYWDELSGVYQAATRISVDDFHYGPLLAGDREMGLLPPEVSGLRCLELGCGAGQNSIYLAARGADCVAIDISEQQLAHGRDLATKRGTAVDFRKASIDDLPRDELGTFDLVHSTYALPFSEQPEKVLRDAAALLREGGCLLLTTGHPVYAGAWMEWEDEEGLFLPDYFQPMPDVRATEDGAGTVASHFHSLGRLTGWIRDAGLALDQLLEPQPLPIPTMSEEEIRARVPYESDDWRELYPQLSRIPVVVIVRCLAPLGHGNR